MLAGGFGGSGSLAAGVVNRSAVSTDGHGDFSRFRVHSRRVISPGALVGIRKTRNLVTSVLPERLHLRFYPRATPKRRAGANDDRGSVQKNEPGKPVSVPARSFKPPRVSRQQGWVEPRVGGGPV